MLGGVRFGGSIVLGPGPALEPAGFAHAGWGTADVSRATVDLGLALDLRIGSFLLGTSLGWETWNDPVGLPNPAQALCRSSGPSFVDVAISSINLGLHAGAVW